MKKPFVRKKERELYFKTGIQQTAEVLFRRPDAEFSLSDIAKEAGVAKSNIGKILDELGKMDLIEITKLSKIWRIKAKQSSWNFRRNKIIYNLNFIYNSRIVEFLDDYFKNPRAIVLFGSFRRGEDSSKSDVDIAVERERGEYETINLSELHEFENQIGRKIQIHIFSRKAVDINVFNNIANGLVLSGFLEVKP